MVWCDRMWRKNWEGSKHWASAGLSEQQIKCNLQYCKIRRRAKCSVERTIRTLTLSSIDIFPRLTFYQICPIPVLTFALNDKWKWKSIWCLLFLFCLSLSPIGVGGRNRAEKLDWDIKSFSSDDSDLHANLDKFQLTGFAQPSPNKILLPCIRRW